MYKFNKIILLCLVLLMGCSHSPEQVVLTDTTDGVLNIIDTSTAPSINEKISITPAQDDDMVETHALTDININDKSFDAYNHDSDNKDENNKNSTDEYSENENRMGIVPKLLQEGNELNDFIYEDWSLLDYISYDFNNDGINDFVGVLERSSEQNLWYPRILFAIKSNENSKFTLDFQDINLIRIYGEGGMNSEPYLPLTTDNHSFTTNAFGGSAWNWTESYTYEYIDCEWYLVKSETIDGYSEWPEIVFYDDYKKGIGVRKYNYSDINYLMSVPNGEFDLVYEVFLDSAPKLTEVSESWLWTSERLSDITAADITDITISNNIDLSINDVPDTLTWLRFIDVNHLIYIFTSKDKHKEYLAVYDREDRHLNVISQASITEDYRYSSFSNIIIYKDMIYCVEESIIYYKMKDYINEEYEYDGVSFIRLIRMNLDGTDKQVVFEYDNNYDGNELQERHLSFITFTYEITGDEIIVQVYTGDEPHPFYRMKLNGSECQLIGVLDKTH